MKPRKKGTIKCYRLDRGFGFLFAEDGREIFFHTRESLKIPETELTPGMRVTFEEVQCKNKAGEIMAVRLLPEGSAE
jgi:cold shock CspA family protein